MNADSRGRLMLRRGTGTSQHWRVWQRWGVFVAVAAMVLALAGCLKLDSNMTINADDTISGSVIYGFDRNILALSGQSEDDFIDELERQAREGTGDEPGNLFGGIEEGEFDIEPYDSERFVGIKYVFSDVPIEELKSEGDDEFSLEHKDDRYILRAMLDLTSDNLSDLDDLDEITPSAPATPDTTDLPDFNNPEQFLGSADLRFKFTFPGKIIDANGDVDGRSVTWTPEFGDVLEMEAEAEDAGSGDKSSDDDSDSKGWLWALGGGLCLLLLLAAGLVTWLLLRRRKRTPAGYPSAPYGAAGPGGQPYGETGQPGQPGQPYGQVPPGYPQNYPQQPNAPAPPEQPPPAPEQSPPAPGQAPSSPGQAPPIPPQEPPAPPSPSR